MYFFKSFNWNSFLSVILLSSLLSFLSNFNSITWLKSYVLRNSVKNTLFGYPVLFGILTVLLATIKTDDKTFSNSFKLITIDRKPKTRKNKFFISDQTSF